MISSTQSPQALQQALDSVFRGKAYRWYRPSDPLLSIKRWWSAVIAWFDVLAKEHPNLFYLLTALLTILLVVILVHVAFIFASTLRAAAERVEISETPALRRDVAWYRGEAERLAREGRYPESMQAEFLALILALDAAKVLRFHPSKTPAEYLSEFTALRTGARDEFGALVHDLYGYAFARWPCDAETLTRWRAHAALDHYAPTR